MREILADIVHHCSPWDSIRITGTDTQTRIQGNKDKKFFLDAYTKAPVPEMAGQFGLTDLPMLSGLLNLPTYKGDEATLGAKREVKAEAETVTEFQFRDRHGAGSNFKTMSASMVGGQADIANIPWNVSVPVSRSKVAEYSQIAALYGKIRDQFGIDLIEGNLIFSLGATNAHTHSATLVFGTEVEGTLKTLADKEFNSTFFLSLLKLGGNNPTTLNISDRAIIQVSVETEQATYNYVLRGDVAQGNGR